MKKPFKKEMITGRAEAPTTPYQRAKREWDDRIGQVRVQAKNWRLIAFSSLIVALVSLGLLTVVLMTRTNNIYVAEITKSGQVMNVAMLKTAYQPTVAQEEYFIAHFVKLVREIPLDPVVAKKNWISAYHFTDQRGSAQLTKLFQKNNPISLLGHQTVTVDITDINPVSDHTYQIDWDEKTVDSEGQNEQTQHYSGVFTIVVQEPTTQEEILKNPLGIFITDFHLSSRDQLS